MTHTLILLLYVTLGWGLAAVLMALAPRLPRWGDRRAFHQLALFAPLLALGLAGAWSVQMVFNGCLMFTTSDGLGTVMLMATVGTLLAIAALRESWRVMTVQRQIAILGEPMPTALYQVSLSRLAHGLRVHPPQVRLLATGRLMACVAGVRRPVLYLSQGLLDRLTANELEAITAHELAHLKHHDNFLAWLDVIVLRAFAFLPPLGLAWRESLAEREEAADAQAATVTGRPLELASALVKVAEAGQADLETFGSEVSSLAAFYDAASPLERRIERLLAFEPGEGRPWGWPAIAALALGALLPFLTVWGLGAATSCGLGH